MEKPEQVPGAETRTVRLLVHGRVQGVFFRRFVLGIARQLGVKGYVRNLSDGRSVEAVAQGKPAAVKEFVNRAKIGPPNAVVASYQTEKLENAPAFLAFDVR